MTNEVKKIIEKIQDVEKTINNQTVVDAGTRGEGPTNRQQDPPSPDKPVKKQN